MAKIATALGLDVYGAAGRLLRIWAWADRQTKNGDADVTLLFVDSLVSTKGMAEAMVLARWLEVPENGRIKFPKFERHNGKSAKKRALAKKRMQRFRNAGGNAGVDAFVTQTTSPEKRRVVDSVRMDLNSTSTTTTTPPQDSPETPSESGRDLATSARALLDFLNEKSGKAFQPTSVNLDFIAARLREGYSAKQCRQVIVRKCRDWLADEKMREYLRPATLFNREKFNQYAGELVLPDASGGPTA